MSAMASERATCRDVVTVKGIKVHVFIQSKIINSTFQTAPMKPGTVMLSSGFSFLHT